MSDDDDRDALAAEYVLGTLSAEEREHAEALRSFDPGFEAAVRQWERRLGELNVMVEAVEPPPEVWGKIKSGISPTTARDEAESPHEEQTRSLVEGSADLGSWRPPAEMPVPTSTGPSAVPPPPPRQVERSADVAHLAQRVRRWRRMTLAVSAIAALLAIYVAVSQVAPELIPPPLRPAATMMASSQEGARVPQDRLVAVLQQGPTAPAFLLTLDVRRRTLVARRISAAPESGKSYQLWLLSSRFGAPRSLGVVGDNEFTERELPGNYDVETLRTASYAVSLEPAGGTQNGPPTGPVLFTGKAVESLPTSMPQAPKT